MLSVSEALSDKFSTWLRWGEIYEAVAFQFVIDAGFAVEFGYAVDSGFAVGSGYSVEFQLWW
jgi:hypothetical protein